MNYYNNYNKNYYSYLDGIIMRSRRRRMARRYFEIAKDICKYAFACLFIARFTSFGRFFALCSRSGKMSYKAKEVLDMLASVQHLVGSLQWGLSLLKENDTVSEERLIEIQKIVNADFRRLRQGLEPVTVVNHLKTRKEKRK